MTLVALSGAYGAGGSRVGPLLAERLGVPFLDRAITAAVADRMEVPLDDDAAHDEQLSARWLERLLSGYVGPDTGAPTPVPAKIASAEDFRRTTEEILFRQASSGGGVILGRGSAILLAGDDRVLRVRLDGPPERRLRQAMSIEGIDEATAGRRMRRQDQAHVAYAKRFYGVDLRDPALYHLVVDSTALPFETTAELLTLAAFAIAR